jgi:hypothetical protein
VLLNPKPHTGVVSLCAEEAKARVCNNITLYTPVVDTGAYFKRRMKRGTHKQLTDKLAASGYDTVAEVDGAPAHLLQLSSCPDAKDIGEVELQDGIQLAVVVTAPLGPFDQLARGIKAAQAQVRAADAMHPL